MSEELIWEEIRDHNAFPKQEDKKQKDDELLFPWHVIKLETKDRGSW